jgi:hypothetical protein
MKSSPVPWVDAEEGLSCQVKHHCSLAGKFSAEEVVALCGSFRLALGSIRAESVNIKAARTAGLCLARVRASNVCVRSWVNWSLGAAVVADRIFMLGRGVNVNLFSALFAWSVSLMGLANVNLGAIGGVSPGALDYV